MDPGEPVSFDNKENITLSLTLLTALDNIINWEMHVCIFTKCDIVFIRHVLNKGKVFTKPFSKSKLPDKFYNNFCLI